MKTKSLFAPPRHSSRGFSLLELLVVMSIIGLLMALIVPQAAQVGTGVSVTSAGNMVTSQLALARQTAISLNRSVEVRVYEVPDKGGTELHYRLLQIQVLDANNQAPDPLFKDKGKLVSLPQNIIFDAPPTSGGAPSLCSSTLINTTDTIIRQGTQKLPSIGSADYAYRAFQFRSGGTTELSRPGPNKNSANTWYYTLRAVTDVPQATALPKNYCTVQVDPYTGQTRSFRP